MMRAIIVERTGGLDALQQVAVPIPEPGPGELRIEVAFAAANWSDIQKRQGVYPDPVRYPAILGAEVSGIVSAVGPGVHGLSTGQRVAALCGARLLGGYADEVVVPADYVLQLPRDLPLDQAAALPLASLTAFHLLHTAYRIRAGQIVLVHAIAGSVGLAVTQVAGIAGARAIGTVGKAGKSEQPRRMGAELVIDRSSEDFVERALAFTDGRGVDLVIDSLGGEILPRSFDALRYYGHLINIGEASGEPDFPVRKKLYERSTAMAGFEVLHAAPGSRTWRRGVRFVEDAVARGRLRMPVGAIFPFEDVAAMHAALEGRGTSGKLLLSVAGGSPT
jgi:NADPH2:quinone reductase